MLTFGMVILALATFAAMLVGVALYTAVQAVTGLAA